MDKVRMKGEVRGGKDGVWGFVLGGEGLEPVWEERRRGRNWVDMG